VSAADPTLALIVTRWRRYGHDRAYVRRGDVELGFRDLKTGAVTCSDDEFADVVRDATAALVSYVPRHSRPADAPAAAAGASPPPASPIDTDHDLALNEPGAAARAQARAVLQAAPVYSRVARLLGVHTDERAWRIGADAEAAVATRLGRLSLDWHILHAVPVGGRGADIDHVAIGPGGVFTLNTKNHPDGRVWVRGDTVKVDGHNQPYVRTSRHEATRAARLLSAAAGFDVEVRAVLVVAGARRGFTVKEQPDDVAVVAAKRVTDYLLNLPPVLGVPSVERIFTVARRESTWRP
jgi:Nuclease-related domain